MAGAASLDVPDKALKFQWFFIHLPQPFAALGCAGHLLGLPPVVLAPLIVSEWALGGSECDHGQWPGYVVASQVPHVWSKCTGQGIGGYRR